MKIRIVKKTETKTYGSGKRVDYESYVLEGRSDGPNWRVLDGLLGGFNSLEEAIKKRDKTVVNVKVVNEVVG